MNREEDHRRKQKQQQRQHSSPPGSRYQRDSHHNHHGERQRRRHDADVFTDEDSSPTFMLMLVGLPGSGKTTFATALEESSSTTATPQDSKHYVRINQDTLGNRKRCEQMTRQVLAASSNHNNDNNNNGRHSHRHRRQCCPIIDRCNFNVVQRKHFVDIARQYNVPVDCIVLDVPIHVCVQRCQDRRNHETIARGQERKVVQMIARQYESPNATIQEGFRRVVHATNNEQVHALIEEYSNIATTAVVVATNR